MANTLNFSRQTKVFIEMMDPDNPGTTQAIWEIPVLDGFSFAQATNTSEITLNEMSKVVSNVETSRRARQLFTDSLAPAEWSFSTYVRPNSDGCVEEVLWANFIALNDYDTTTYPTNSWKSGVTKNSGSNTTEFSFSDSNVVRLGTFNIYFVLGGCSVAPTENGTSGWDYDFSSNTVYKLSTAVSNAVSIDFEIDGIATLNWSGFAQTITEEDNWQPTQVIQDNIDSTSNFIRNRLTTITLEPGGSFDSTLTASSYNLTLTGGTISFENNISYLTPEELCKVNIPLEHVTGTRSISGNFTCYLDASDDGSEELFEDLATNQNNLDLIRNSFDLVFKVGGSSAPNMIIELPQAHLEVPAHSIEDVISVDVSFHGLPSDVDQADEATITYTGV